MTAKISNKFNLKELIIMKQVIANYYIIITCRNNKISTLLQICRTKNSSP